VALRKGQKELIEQYRGGYCAVPAIPGGGKTYALSMWAAEMISLKLHKPGKILIVTYMNSAVNNFKQRIATELMNRGITGNKDYFASTIHGLCLQIIKEKPDVINVSEEFEIVDEISKINFINNSVDEWKRKNEDTLKWFIDEACLSTNNNSDTYKNWEEKFAGVMLSAIGDFKSRGMNPNEAKEKCRILKNNSLLKCAADIYALYDKKLKMNGFMDFDDMLYSAKKLLSTDSSLLEKYRKKYTYVCEDEAQDSNLIQNDILTLIANGNFLRVGDSNQAICGSFSNSDFKLFKNFCQSNGTTVYRITESSRNTRNIINLANYFITYVREKHPVEECRDSLLPQYIETVELTDEHPNPIIDNYGIKAEIFKTWEEEAYSVVSEAAKFLKTTSEKTVAILVPNSWKIKEVVRILESKNIPFEQLDNTSGERNKAVRALGRVLDFIGCPENGRKLADMMKDCILIGSYDEVTLEANEKHDLVKLKQFDMLYAFLIKYPVEKILYPVKGEISIDEVPEELKKTKIWEDFLKSLSFIKELLEFPTLIIENLILFISDKLEFNKEERAIAQKIAGEVRYLISQNHRLCLNDLAAMLLEPKNMFSYFTGVIWELKGYEPKPGIITVSTYHKSKGLEWDAVFLTSMNYSDFPVLKEDKFIGEYWFLKQEYKNPQAIAKADMELILDHKSNMDSILKSKLETISEKARLLYVGITRAKERLFLSGYHSNPGKKNEALPSKYLIELKNFIEEVGSKWP
jgi:DNA helicase II / ATP-dependent DNA helicase PcrA